MHWSMLVYDVTGKDLPPVTLAIPIIGTSASVKPCFGLRKMILKIRWSHRNGSRVSQLPGKLVGGILSWGKTPIGDVSWVPSVKVITTAGSTKEVYRPWQ